MKSSSSSLLKKIVQSIFPTNSQPDRPRSDFFERMRKKRSWKQFFLQYSKNKKLVAQIDRYLSLTPPLQISFQGLKSHLEKQNLRFAENDARIPLVQHYLSRKLPLIVEIVSGRGPIKQERQRNLITVTIDNTRLNPIFDGFDLDKQQKITRFTYRNAYRQKFPSQFLQLQAVVSPDLLTLEEDTLLPLYGLQKDAIDVLQRIVADESSTRNGEMPRPIFIHIPEENVVLLPKSYHAFLQENGGGDDLAHELFRDYVYGGFDRYRLISNFFDFLTKNHVVTHLVKSSKNVA